MRKRFETQLELGAAPIEEVKINLKSRDELPPVMQALQYIYTNPELNQKVFEVLERKIKTLRIGRPGMNLWEILVLGVVRLTLDIDYDRLEHTANNDLLVRNFLGLNSWSRESKQYSLQSLKDNVGLLTSDVLAEINCIVVTAGHSIVKKKDEALNIKIDTYPLQTNVHFPTDVNLLWDSARKSIDLTLKLIEGTDIKGWRKGQAWKRVVKNAFIGVNKLMKGGGKNKPSRMRSKTRAYLRIVKHISIKIDETIPQIISSIASNDLIKASCLMLLREYKMMLDKHIDLVERRILKGETIPHSEKVFSIFEPHTEWIQKGKAGKKVDLGLNVLVATDQYGFCVHNHVCEKEHDVMLAVPTVSRIMEQYQEKPGSVSFDRGFWSRDNFAELKKIVPEVIMPKKGKLNRAENEREQNKIFIAFRRRHSVVESDINSLEHHGLNRCPDKGLPHFKRYVGLGVLSFNMHRLGNLLMVQERKKLKKQLCAVQKYRA